MCSYYVCLRKTVVICCVRTAGSVAGVESQKKRVFDGKMFSWGVQAQAQTRSVGVWNEVLVGGKERGVVLSIVHCIHFLPPSSGLL